MLAVVAGCKDKDAPPPPPPVEPPDTAAAAGWFEDVTDKVGLAFTHDGGPTGDFFMPQSMVAGCALFDADGDGRLDLLLLQSTGPKTGKTNHLYLQKADGTFRDATAGSGLDFDGYNVGVAVGDYDNDGKPDVLVTQFVGAKLLRNVGGGKFQDVSAAAGIVNPLWGSSAAFLDYDRDGWLDLVVVNYLDYDKSWPCTAPDGSRDFCGPKTFPGTAAKLFRNRGTGGFEDVTVPAGLAAKSGPGLGVYCADLTADGWPDIFVTNDGKPNFLWVNQTNGTFKEEALSRGVALTGMGEQYANMGIAAADYDGDGLTDLFVTHLSNETHTLWKQGPAGLFRDRTTVTGVAKTKWRGTGFGAVAADFDRDGSPDIAFVNGKVYAGTPPPGADHLPKFWRAYAERNQLLKNDGTGAFLDISADNTGFCGRPNVARGLALGDYDNDGRPDLLVLGLADRARLYRNVAAGGNWVAVRAADPFRGNRDLLGTEVRVTAGGRTQVQFICPEQSYLSACEPVAHFGLGAATTYDKLEVRWPSGEKELLPGGPANQVRLIRPTGGKKP
jgi:hypothetical protein